MKKDLKLIALSLSAMLLTACGRTEIIVNDYFSTKTEGANGRAKIVGELNTLAMVQSNREAFDVGENASEAELRGIVDTINSNIEGEFDKKEALSNGDTVSFKWDTSRVETIESAYKHVKLITEDKSVTVSGLKEIVSFNPFDYITVSYTHSASNENGKIDVKWEDINTPPISFGYGFHGISDLHCGDTFTIEIDRTINGKELTQEQIEEYYAEKGFELTEWMKEYKVPDSMDEIEIVD